MKMKFLLLASVISLSGIAPAQEGQPRTAGQASDSPLLKDKTGMKWVLPFSSALAHAKEAKRVLMVKPVAFGTEKSGGW